MPHRNHIMATAGHVDHGKSTLVQALTGTHPDRLPEEKARGITIDLGFAHFELPDPAGAGCEDGFSVGVVDVPGHEDFVTNMVAGVGSVDLALLVVAADDGWMPQTEEHLQILSYAGVRHAVVALTKADLVEGALDDVVSDIQGRLRDSPFAAAPIVPVSATTGQGMDALRQRLLDVLRSMPPSPDQGKPRLTVDRAFTMQGIGTVVTGTLSGGTLRKGQPAVVQPAGLPTRIRSVQNHHRDVDVSGPGTRTALNLTDVAVAGREGNPAKGVRRGDTITLPELGVASAVMDVLLEKSARLKEGDGAAARPLKDGSKVRLHLGSGNGPARIRLLEARALPPGGRMLAQVRLETPAFAFAGDRFILRDGAERWTLAGGVVLNPVSDRVRVRSKAHLGMLRLLAEGGLDASNLIRGHLACEHMLPERGWLRQARLSDADLAAAVETLTAGRAVERVDGWLIDPTWWAGLIRTVTDAIDASHREHPERPGLEVAGLKRLLGRRIPSEEGLRVLLNNLMQHGCERAGTLVRRADHRPALPAHLQAAGESMRAALLVKPFEPPSRKELMGLTQGAEVLRFLIQSGEAVDLGGDTVLAAASLVRATRMIRRHLARVGGATVSELRQLLGTNRRVIIPLVERLDRDRVTVRQGDRRVPGSGA